ncbi:MAG: ABC transporter permease [Sulfolobales archaeon]
MRDLIRSAKAVLVAYFIGELVRSKGLTYGLLSLAVWLSMFIVPASLFVKGGMESSLSAGVLIGSAIFLAYSTATWDWAVLLRWLMQLGILEYVVASGSSIFSHYLGTVPVSVAWYSMALTIAYAIVSVFLGPPKVVLVDPVAFAIGVLSLLIVLMAYSFILGGTLLAAGTAGPIVEFIGWILPIATGGLTPLAFMPKPLQVLAYSTPFSYPAELLRYSLGVSNPVLEPSLVIFIGAAYSMVFLGLSSIYLKYQIRRMLKEGVRSAALF